MLPQTGKKADADTTTSASTPIEPSHTASDIGVGFTSEMADAQIAMLGKRMGRVYDSLQLQRAPVPTLSAAEKQVLGVALGLGLSMTLAAAREGFKVVMTLLFAYEDMSKKYIEYTGKAFDSLAPGGKVDATETQATLATKLGAFAYKPIASDAKAVTASATPAATATSAAAESSSTATIFMGPAGK